jgi:8-oxo-dGTP diphosphatase
MAVYQRVGTYGLIFNKEQKVLIVKRSLTDSMPGLWEFPGGGLEVGEDPKIAVGREVKEEAGLDVDVIKPVTVISHFQYRKSNKHTIRIVYLCRMLDEQQEVTLSEEHSEYQWVNPEDTQTLEKSDFLKRIFKEFNTLPKE